MRSRHANGRAPDRLAPLCPRGRDVGARHRGVEHLHQMRALAQRCERIEKGLKDAGSAQPPEPFPDRIPMAELHRKGAPGDVVDRKIMQRLQKLPVVPSFVATARAHRPENLQNNRPVILGHRRQHGRSSEKPTAHESLKNRFGNRLASLSPPNPALCHVSLDASAYASRNPSTRPSLSYGCGLRRRRGGPAEGQAYRQRAEDHSHRAIQGPVMPLQSAAQPGLIALRTQRVSLRGRAPVKRRYG